MANEEQLSILKQGVMAWNKWRGKNSEIKVELMHANLMRVDLGGEIHVKTGDISTDPIGAIRIQADLHAADLRGANLSGAILIRADLSNADLTGADLSGAISRKVNHIKDDLVEDIDNRIRQIQLLGADLPRSDLRREISRRSDIVRASLIRFVDESYRTDLSGADLSGAILRGADLSGANLRGVNLEGADLREAMITGADLSVANLREADLKGAQLDGAKLIETSLYGTKFSESTLHGTLFINVYLVSAIGLNEVRHKGPSTIGLDTIAKSRGEIPEVFLRGCGLSDWEIEQSKLHKVDLSNEEINSILYKVYDLRATQALQISPLFISYSHADDIFVNRLEGHLNKNGIRFWRDIHDMKAGRIEKQIDIAIRQNPTVVLILSKSSQKSDFVEHEVRAAKELEKELGRDVLCPVALDDTWKSSLWPKRIIEQIMEYNILDFSEWKDDVKFEGMFRKLIDGLELFYKG